MKLQLVESERLKWLRKKWHVTNNNPLQFSLTSYYWQINLYWSENVLMKLHQSNLLDAIKNDSAYLFSINQIYFYPQQFNPFSIRFKMPNKKWIWAWGIVFRGIVYRNSQNFWRRRIKTVCEGTMTVINWKPQLRFVYQFLLFLIVFTKCKCKHRPSFLL